MLIADLTSAHQRSQRISRWVRLSLGLLLVVIGLGRGGVAQAGEIEIRSKEVINPVVGQIPEGAVANVTVYMESAGDLLGDIPLVLVEQATGNKIAQKVTKSDGIIVFENIPPGKYEVLNAMPRERKRRTTAKIADFVIKPIRTQQQMQQK